MGTDKRALMLYVHIPFCIKKCRYCDFLSYGTDCRESGYRKAYIEALCAEIAGYGHAAENREITSVFIGGGTPSILSCNEFKKIADTLYDTFEISDKSEFTIECNPGTVTAEKLYTYKENGINRISFGLQSTDDKDLSILGRVHTYTDFEESYELARSTGFHNINIDLMSAIPGQDIERWKTNLERVISLEPEHISAYSLIIEEGTPFYDIYGENGEIPKNMPLLPDEDTERKMYYLTKEILHKAGYERYEISNYSKKGYECRHNCGYWKGTEYLGFGLGAASLFDGYRFSNLTDIKEYVNIPVLHNGKTGTDYKAFADKSTFHKLTARDRIEEFMFLGLRMTEGVSTGEFKARFGRNIADVYGDILLKHRRNGLLDVTDDNIKFTERGIDLSNMILSDFLL